MTAPTLERMKFWIVKPYGGTNYLKNPAFAEPVGVTYWAATQAAVAVSGDEQRRGAYSMKVTPVSGKSSYVVYAGLAVTAGLAYTFSCDVKGVAGQAMRIYIGSGTATTFTATGYWQRIQVTYIIPGGTTTSYVVVQRDSVASAAPFYVDGVQFEQTIAMTTFIEGNQPGCGWVGLPLHSASWRDPRSGKGGLLIDISTYAKIISVHGLGNGNWNQILTKMASGGDMYQTHIRKSRNFSMVLAYHGNNQGDLQANRKVIIDALRPDYLFGEAEERRIIRYQGFSANGDEATQPVDIVCVPQPFHTDTPSMPVFQKDILNFTIPSGLLDGAYNEGKELDLYADFPAERIVKRDANGNWCEWNGSSYDNLMKGQGATQGLNNNVRSMAEGPDGKIYVGGAFTNAGGVSAADYLARWNPVTAAWEAVVSGLNQIVQCMAFDANGDLYIGGYFTDLGSSSGDYIVKLSGLDSYPATVTALGTGTNNTVFDIKISSEGDIYVGGMFTSAGGVANTSRIAKWNGTTWSALSTGLNSTVYALAFAPNGDLYIGGAFTNVSYPRICKWNNSSFSAVGTAGDINNNSVVSLAFANNGTLIVGGDFTDVGGIAGGDYIIFWNGSMWQPFQCGTPNGLVRKLVFDNNKLYISGDFTSIGSLSISDRVAIYFNGAWQLIDIDFPGSAAIDSILPASDGSLYIGGNFSTAYASENAKTGIVALNLNVTLASANTYPVISITGPGTLKSIKNYRTGKSVMFDGLTLQAGEWISLNFDPLNLSFRSGWVSRGNLMRYIIPGSDYGDFYVSPGANYISLFMGDDVDSNTKAGIVWVPKFWGIDGALL